MKEKLLLTYYLQQNRLIKLTEIARDFRISQRKAQMLIQDFNYFSRKTGCLLKARTNLGYELIVQDAPKMADFIKETASSVAYLNPNHRRLLTQIYLVSQTSYVSRSQLSDYLGASKSTITADLKALAPKMAAFQLEITAKTYYGLRVTGSELNKRLCLIKAVNLLPVMTLEEELGDYQVSEDFQQAVRELFGDYQVNLTESVFLTIVQYMVVMVERLKEQQSLIYQTRFIENNVESLRLPLKELIESWYDIVIPDVEIDYLIDYMGDQLISFQENETCYEAYTVKGLNRLKQKTGIKVVAEEVFYQKLSKHLLNLQGRITYGTQILFPQRKKYYHANFFEVVITQLFLQELAEEVDFTKMTIDEVLYVSLYFKGQLLTDKNAFDYYAKKIIVMAESRSMGYLLKGKIQQLYPSMTVTIFDNIDLLAIRERIDSYDLAITSKRLSHEEQQSYPSIMEVADYLSQEEQVKLRKKIKELFEWPRLETDFREGNYHYFSEKSTSLELLENQALIISEPFLALAFAVSDEDEVFSVAIAHFKQPQVIKEKKISLLFTINFTQKDIGKVIELCELLQKIAQTDQYQNDLLGTYDFVSFKECLCKVYLSY